MSPKNIIICCDGTNNKLADDHTNVVRLFEVAVKDTSQIVFYDPGVGTMAAPDQTSAIGKRWSLIKGLAFGDGLDENVFEAYRYLMDHYQVGDQVYLFGFSRGAFTVRVLAGFLHGVGLLHAGSENLLPYCWEMYRQLPATDPGSPDHKSPKAAKIKAGVDSLSKSFTRSCPIAFLGVWDTVGSVGMYNMNQTFPFTFYSPEVMRVRHAVSLDELRAGFRSNVYEDRGEILPNSSPKVMNVWFPGVHSDIGGGYPFSPAESGLAMGAFKWMVTEAQSAGLKIDPAACQQLLADCSPNSTAVMHESLKGAWKVMEYLPARRFNWAKDKRRNEWRWKPNKPREMGVTRVYLHKSTIDRIEKCSGYWPASLPRMDLADLKKKFPIVS